MLIADSHPAARASLRALLARSGFVVCGEAGDAAAAVELAARERADACLIDVALPGGGLAAIQEIAAVSPQTAIVVFTDSTDPDDLFDAIQAGAVGYLLKDMRPQRLPDAVRGVLAGEAAIPRPLVAMLVGELQSQATRRLVVGVGGRAHFTKRELEVARLLGARAGTSTIARRLFISPVTARRHISSIVKKLGVANREAAARLLAGD